MSTDTQKAQCHWISNTHWDREWYQPFEEFRIRLVLLVDKLLYLLDTDPGYRYFMLDGQTIALDDYLAIRPENRAKIEGYVRDGRIQIGPWYILPDEFLVSGESTIRRARSINEASSRGILEALP